jgi:hypothetical protein
LGALAAFGGVAPRVAASTIQLAHDYHQATCGTPQLRERRFVIAMSETTKQSLKLGDCFAPLAMTIFGHP